MKTIVTHLSPDFDALTSIWLIKRFLDNWKEAEIVYVPAGSTYENNTVDTDPEIIHVDTGLGKFDHHQNNYNTCAAKLVFNYLHSESCIPSKIEEALSRFVEFVNEIDHFKQAFFPDASSDRYDFNLYQTIEGLKSTVKDKTEYMDIIFKLFDAQLQILRNKVIAEAEIKKGYIFESSFGKTLIMESKNSEAATLALKIGYHLAVQKDPVNGNIRIKTLPLKELILDKLYEKILKADKVGSWFLHASKHLLLNGSSKNPHFAPSPLTIKRLIEIIKTV